MKHYIVFVVGCTDPELRGPFDIPDKRDEAVLALNKDEANYEDALFALDIDDEGNPNVWPYSGGFMECGTTRISIVEKMHLKGLEASDLDELVDETVSRCGSKRPSSDINNDGVNAQLDFILEAGVEEEAILEHLGLEQIGA